MTGAIYAAAAGEFFGALKEIVIRIPKFDERRKVEIQKETEKLITLESLFHKAAVEFSYGSRSDELLGLAQAVRDQEKYLKNLYVIYSKELETPPISEPKQGK